MLSGFISQWRTPQFFRCFSAIKSCFAYALTAVNLRPIFRPNFFKTSRRFIWRDSKTKQRWFRYLKLDRKRTQWRLFSGSWPTNFFNITSSVKPALYLNHIKGSSNKSLDSKGIKKYIFSRLKVLRQDGHRRKCLWK